MLILWTISIVSILANDPPLTFEKISNKEGLNQNSISSIIQDKTGFIWMGTPNGLIKYDGNSFSSYISHPGDSTTLLNNLVLDLFEDSKERIWLGTHNGLCFYHPNKDEFVWIQSFNKLIDKTITIHKIIESNDERIWLATSKGLYVLSPNKANVNQFEVKKITQAQTGQQLFPKNTTFTDLYELADSSFLVSSSNGLYHLKKNKADDTVLLNSFKTLDKKNLNIKKIFRDTSGLFWIGSVNGIKFLNVLSEGDAYVYNWEKKPKYYTEKLSLNDNNISSFIYDKKGSILIGTVQEGLFRYSEKDGRIENYKPQAEHPGSISSDFINDMMMDRSGVIWLATAHGGLNKIDTNRKPFFNISAQHFNSNGLSSNLVNGIMQDSKGRLWVGTYQKGLNVSKETFSFTDIYKTEFDYLLEGQQINCFYETPEQLVIIGTAKGIKIYDLNKEAFIDLPNQHPIHTLFGIQPILSLFQIENEIWMGTRSNLNKISLKNNTLDLISGDFDYQVYGEDQNSISQAPSSGINTMMYDPEMGLWLGTRDGLYLLRKNSTEFEVFRYNVDNDQSISNNNIFSLHKDKQTKQMWVGTFGGGLNKIRINSNKRVTGFERITKRDGLPDNAIYSILEDANGFLWISTDEGIAKFNTNTQEVKVFNMADGLSANNFRKNSSLMLDNGIMLMGGLNGLTVFNPLNISENSYPPIPMITHLKVLNESVCPNKAFHGQIVLKQPIYKTEEIHLPYDLNQVTFEFAAMHYAAPQKNTFNYMLEGVDKTWISVDNTQRFANYSQLRPGSYLFKLKSFNGDGLESQQIRTMRVVIEPPFYLTNQAFLLYIILSVIAGLLIYRYAKDMIRLRRRIAVEERERQHINEINEAKLKFFTDVSHEFRTPLTLIISPLERVLNDKRLPPDLKKRISNINENGQKLLNLTNTLIDFRKVGQGKLKLEPVEKDLGTFIRRTAKAFQDYADDRNMNFIIHIPEEAVKGWFDPGVIERVLFNLLSNAFKYSPTNGKIEVSLERQNQNVAVIKVIDTGKGMTPEEVEHIFERFFHGKQGKSLFGSSGIGLSLVKKLIDLHQGQIEVSSVLHQGTTFKITLPIHNKPPYLVVSTNKTAAQNAAPANVVKPSNPSIQSEKTRPAKEISTLLVVEDNPEIQKLIVDIFENRFKVLTAGNGEEGFNLAAEFTPDIIISDVMMPKMDGFEMGAKLKNDIRTSHIPLVMLTALNDFESKKTGFEEGGDVYISKPFSPQLLELQINNLIKTKQKEADFLKKILLMELNNPNEDEKPKVEVVPMKESETEPKIKSRDDIFLETVRTFIEDNYESTDLNVHMLAQAVFLSYIQFYRKFKALTGINAKEYIRIFRLKKAAAIMKREPDKSVREIMFSVGFSSQSHFTTAFKKYYKVTPGEYKKNV